MSEMTSVDFDDLTDEEKVTEMIMMSEAMRSLAELVVTLDQEFEVQEFLNDHNLELEIKLLDSCYHCVEFYNDEERENLH